MSTIYNNTHSSSGKISKPIKVALALMCLATAALVYICSISHPYSPMEKLAKEFYYIDDDGLHWDYVAMFKAYCESRDSTSEKQLLNLMVKSRAAHLVPQIIDSIRAGGFMDTERKIRAIIELTGHDFTENFDIKVIWEKEEVDKTKLILHQWWGRNREDVIKSRGPKKNFNVPNHWPSLTFDLKTEKKRYLKLEPIRITAILKNNSDIWFTFPYKFRKPAFTIEFFKVLNNGNLVNVAKTSYPAIWGTCGNTRRWFIKPGFFVIDADSHHILQQWINSTSELGNVTLRAVLSPLYGEHKGKKLSSGDLTINIVEPMGSDAEAYKFITRRESVDIEDGRKFGPGFILHGGLIRNSGSHHGRPIHEYFLKNYGDSSYANYVRYTLATDALFSHNPEVFYKHMTDITSKAPITFPLLADSYAHLLEYYKEKGEIDTMATFSGTIKLENINVVNPMLLKQLSKLIKYAETSENRVKMEKEH